MGRVKNKPLVSIITPSYNQGRFIEETIKSVLLQDYLHIEYIVVDGDSTDNTLDILNKYEGRLRWISEKDKGQSDAINKGFRIANGEILAWLNSDDVYLPGAVSRAVKFFNAHPDVAMVYGKGYNMDESGRVLEECPTEEFDLNRFMEVNFVTQPSVFFKREAYFYTGGVDEALHYTMDYDLWMRIGKRFKVAYIRDFLSSARLHAEAKTVSDVHALRYQKECLYTILRHYGRVPAKHVFGYYYYLVKGRLPERIAEFKPLIVFLTTIVSFFEYLRLNRGIRFADIKVLKPGNIKKLFTGWRAGELLKKKT